MKKYILLFAIALVVITAKAYDYDYARCYKSVKLTYQSIDENNEPITLSELVTIPLEKDMTANRQIGFFLLTSEPWSDSKDNTYATGESPVDALVLRTIATEGAMVVSVDGQGNGVSQDHLIPYCANKLTARQAIDGLLAAMDYAQKNGISVADDYYTINAGYSLAGGQAVAIQRYLEKYSSAAEKARVRLKKTISGGAAIDMSYMAQYSIDEAKKNGGHNWMALPMSNLAKVYKGSTMKTIDLDEIFINDTTLNIENLESQSASSRAFWKVAAQENMEKDWTPETPIDMVFLRDDATVPYQTASLALKAWGKKKFNIIQETAMSKKKWNISMLRPIRDYVNKYAGLSIHLQGAVDFYSGMIDGCLRDTLIASSYGRTLNFKDMLMTIFDIGSGLNIEVPVNISTKLTNGLLTIRTLNYCHFTGDLADSLGNKTLDFDVTIRPEVLDQSMTKITQVDAAGYLNIPADFKVVYHGNLTDINLTGSCDDLYAFIQNLTAVVLHHKCTSRSDAEKYCNALNNSMKITAKALIFSGSIIAWYEREHLLSGDYIIEPYLKIGLIKTKLSKWYSGIEDYMTIDNKSITISGKTATFHVTEDGYGEQKFYADIVDADNKNVGRADFDVTGVDMNSDGTQQTLHIDFTVTLNDIPIKITGTCANLNDAVLATLLCYGNLSCQTEDEAKAYAETVNDNVQMELYYKIDGEYQDYGTLKAVSAKDSQGAYFAQYVLDFMNKGSLLPVETVISMLIK